MNKFTLNLLYCGSLVFILIGGFGCSSSQEVAQLTVEKRFEAAVKIFTNGDFREAYEEFKIITLQFQGSSLADDAQYYMGECQASREDWLLAAYEYETLVRSLPTSEFVARARYKIALCYYKRSPKSVLDQNDTKKAIDEFQSFIEYHPSDSLVKDAENKIKELVNKLAKKEFESGVIYMRMQYYKSAINSFDYVLEKYYDTQYADQAQLKKAEALLLRQRAAEAKKEIEKFFLKYPSSSLTVEGEKLKQEIEIQYAAFLKNPPKVSSDSLLVK
ncbi:MAG: outer membrane protein assembly factor BamD [bacterium]